MSGLAQVKLPVGATFELGDERYVVAEGTGNCAGCAFSKQDKRFQCRQAPICVLPYVVYIPVVDAVTAALTGEGT